MNHGADLAIVAEPTLLDIVHCHKGVLRWKIRTSGVACHSSTPELDERRTIYRMARKSSSEPSKNTPRLSGTERLTPSSGYPPCQSDGSRAARA